MQLLRRIADLLYVTARFLWRRLPLSWRDRIRFVWHGRHPLRAVIDLPFEISDAVWRRAPFAWRRRLSRGWHYEPPVDARRQIHEDLRQHLHAGPGPSVVMLPLLSWFECGFQRPHQMARALAAEGCPVVFYEPWEIGPRGQHGLALTASAEHERQFVGVREVSERLCLLRVPHWFLAECLVETPPDCLVMLWPSQARFIPRESPSMVVYEMVDAHELLPSAASWRRTHRKWLREADVVVATASDLVESIRPLREDVLLVPNGVQIEEWAATPADPVPSDLRRPRRAPVVVVYYGAIRDERFDWQMWEHAASARPDWAFVLIGFPMGIDDEELARRVSRRDNLFYLGPKPHAELPRYMAHADVAAIPFKLNPVTHASSTLKLFEYMAAGKPIVATPTRESLKYPCVLVADNPQAFVQRLDEAVQKRTDPQYLALLKAEAEANTWQSRARALRRAIESARARQNGVARRKLRSSHGGTVQ